jgi:hypothetical protein
MTAQRVSIHKKKEGEEERGKGEDRYIERGGKRKSKKDWYENAPRLYKARIEGQPLCPCCSSCYATGSRRRWWAEGASTRWRGGGVDEWVVGAVEVVRMVAGAGRGE